jgi:hypothetical protein
MTKEIQMTNDEKFTTLLEKFVIRASSFLRHSPGAPKHGEGGSFVIRHYV